MANIQAPIPPSIMDKICCAILCCEEAKYKLKKKKRKRGKDGKLHDATCTRLGHRKHSCVLHKLRKKEGKKLTTENKHTHKASGTVLEASPRYPKGKKPPDAIPDIKYGNVIVDAKFPCDASKATFTNGEGKASQEMGLTDTGKSMLTDKEKTTYTKVDGGCQVEGMSPQDAKDTIKGECKCEDK